MRCCGALNRKRSSAAARRFLKCRKTLRMWITSAACGGSGGICVICPGQIAWGKISLWDQYPDFYSAGAGTAAKPPGNRALTSAPSAALSAAKRPPALSAPTEPAGGSERATPKAPPEPAERRRTIVKRLPALRNYRGGVINIKRKSGTESRTSF